MRSIGGIVLASAILLTGCAAPANQQPTTEKPETTQASGPKWITKDGQPFDINSVSFNGSEMPDFQAAATKVPGFTNIEAKELEAIGHDLCEHYAGGFTTADLRAASISGNGDNLAALGEAAKATICAKQ